MTLVTLVSSFTNPNRRRRIVSGELVGVTPLFWVVREPGERLNQVLDRDLWEKE